MFGISILTKKKLTKMKQDIEERAFNAAITDIIALLKKSDKVFLEPVTLVGDGQIIKNCVFLGIKETALTIEKK